MEEKDLEKLTATELRELALKQYPDITGVHAMKKEELIAAIHKARGEAVKETKKKKVAAKVQIDGDTSMVLKPGTPADVRVEIGGKR